MFWGIIMIENMGMNKLQPKPIGTVSVDEVKNMSTNTPWEPVTNPDLPFSVMGTPSGYLFTHGSACASLATTSILGQTYVAHALVFRQDGTAVDVDGYFGSITPTNTLGVLKINSSQIPYHHLKANDPILNNLPSDKREQVLNIIGTQVPV